MKKINPNKLSAIIPFLLLGLIIFAVAGCSTETKKSNGALSSEDLVAAADKVDSLFLVAFNSGDLEGIMNLHWNSPELIAYPPGEMQMTGWDEVRESYVKEFTNNKGASLSYTSTKNIPFENGVAGYGTFTWTLPVEGQAPMIVEGRYSDIKAFKDGKMVIMHDHTSMPMMSAEPDSTQVNQ